MIEIQFIIKSHDPILLIYAISVRSGLGKVSNKDFIDDRTDKAIPPPIEY